MLSDSIGVLFWTSNIHYNFDWIFLAYMKWRMLFDTKAKIVCSRTLFQKSFQGPPASLDVWRNHFFFQRVPPWHEKLNENIFMQNFRPQSIRIDVPSALVGSRSGIGHRGNLRTLFTEHYSVGRLEKLQKFININSTSNWIECHQFTKKFGTKIFLSYFYAKGGLIFIPLKKK